MTAIRGSTVAVVGGSIAGCAAAIALSRCGCEVTVLKRTRSELQNRGGGIAIPVPLRDGLIAGGYFPADYPFCPLDWRIWLVQEEGESMGRTVWRQATAAIGNNWGVLWCSLRGRFADGVYPEGALAEWVSPSDAGVEVKLADGTGGRFDVLVAPTATTTRCTRKKEENLDAEVSAPATSYHDRSPNSSLGESCESRGGSSREGF